MKKKQVKSSPEPAAIGKAHPKTTARRPLQHHQRKSGSGSAALSHPVAGIRSDTCQIAGHFPKATRSALKYLEARTGRTLQDLLGEAINDLLSKQDARKQRR